MFFLSECETGWFELIPYGCYALKSSQKNWDQWKQECDNEDAVLVTIETEAEYNALEQYMEYNKGQWSSVFWRGLMMFYIIYIPLSYFTGTEEIIWLEQSRKVWVNSRSNIIIIT